MRQKFELGQCVVVYGQSKDPVPSQRRTFKNEMCVVKAVTLYHINGDEPRIEYRVVLADEYGEKDASIYRVNEEAMHCVAQKECTPVASSSGEYLFIHKSFGNHFYGEILHTTDEHIFIRQTSPSVSEMLIVKSNFKIFKEEKV